MKRSFNFFFGYIKRKLSVAIMAAILVNSVSTTAYPAAAYAAPSGFDSLSGNDIEEERVINSLLLI